MKVEIGSATLYMGDCMDILPTLPKVDAVITDPPYGINIASKGTVGGNGKAVATDYGENTWDSAIPSPEVMLMIDDAAKWRAYFGGNYFPLPPSSCWLVWDKMNTGNFADCELCWTNWPGAVRRLQWRWNGMIRQGNEERYHPTQKPLEVMKWVIELCPKAETILDPFMGSGTTGVAAIQLGRKFIGIEREPKYFDIACKRIEQAVAQGQLFEPEQTKQVQEQLI
jgi:site-specific DNA-methyltransferase (adenine-specific)/modification methylase